MSVMMSVISAHDEIQFFIVMNIATLYNYVIVGNFVRSIKHFAAPFRMEIVLKKLFSKIYTVRFQKFKYSSRIPMILKFCDRL